MLARIVENWLTNAGELGYQTPFAQLLASEGYQLLHGPVHHPFEHGKDIVARAPDGTLHAFQLKGGDLGLTELERLQGQLHALTTTAITYPGVEPPRRPDRVFLVTSGRLSPPARDRIRSINDGQRPLQLPPIEVVEQEQLVARFVASNGNYLPSAPRDLNSFLEILLHDGRGPFPIEAFSDVLRDSLGLNTDNAKRTELRRALGSAVIFTAYVAGAWERLQNHLGVAEAWLTVSLAILHTAERLDLADADWRLSFELARDSARAAFRRLMEEAAGADNLVIPHIAEGLVYRTRALIVCGYCSAFYLSERELEDLSDVEKRELGEALKTLIDRERGHIACPGEAAIAFVLMLATALEILNDKKSAILLILQTARELIAANQPGSQGPAADPYHSMEEVLLHTVGADTTIDDERFDGNSYGVHVMLEWLARRNFRRLGETLWPDITRIHHCEFRPSQASELLSHRDDKGTLHTWAFPMPTSWSELHRRASRIHESELPSRLWRDLYFLPYLPLLFPYRLSSAVGKGIDYFASPDRCTVEFTDEQNGEQTATAPPDSSGGGAG